MSVRDVVIDNLMREGLSAKRAEEVWLETCGHIERCKSEHPGWGADEIAAWMQGYRDGWREAAEVMEQTMKEQIIELEHDAER